MNKLFLIITLVIINFTGCSQSVATNQNPKPSWTINPNQGGVTGAVGIAGRTYDQKESTRRKYAITRALEEFYITSKLPF